MTRMSGVRPATDGGYAALLRRPGYVPFVLTVGLSRLTGTMFVTSGVLLVLTRTHDVALAGATTAAGTLAWAFSAPLLGAWLDVARSRRLLIVLDQLVSVAGLLALVALAGHAPGWTLIADAVLLSLTRPFTVGGFLSLVSELAGPDLLDRASSVEATSLNLSFVIGPALAGLLAGAIGAAGAISVQAGLTLVSALLIAINPLFDRRPAERAPSARRAMRAGLSALWNEPILRRTGGASMLAMSGWGLMMVGFPLYAVHSLHSGAHAGGYLWAAVGLGSALGTFGLAGTPSLIRVGLSYGVLGLSALLWPLAGTLAVGFALVTLTGFLEGPAYSGTIALRQRHAPPTVRVATMSTLNSFTLVANSAGAALAGWLGRPIPLIYAFVVLNLLAMAVAGVPRGRHLRARPPDPAEAGGR